MSAAATMPVATGVAPPHSLQAEEAVLGGVLISGGVLPALRLQEGLEAVHFYRETHRRVWEAMCALNDEGAAIDVLTVTSELERRGTLEEAGGRAAIDALTGGVPGLGGIRRYAQIVVQHWIARERLSAAHEQVAGILNHDPATWEAGLQRAHAVVASGAKDGYLGKDKLADHIMAWLDEPAGVRLPLPAHLPSIGRMVRLRAGDLTVLAAWPSGGKTSTALALAAAAGQAGHRVVIWTNEDTEVSLVAKHICAMTGIPAFVVEDRRVADGRMSTVMAELGRLPFEVQPCHGWTAAQIAAHIGQVRPAVAIVDHFHNMAQIGKVAEVDESIRVLAAAAGQTGTHLVLCAQLNRNRLNGVCKPPPVLADLRGSAMFEAAAHTMLLVHRDQEEVEDASGGKTGKAMQLASGSIDVAKNKATGKTGVVKVTFDKQRLRFVEAAAQEPAAQEEPAKQEEWGF